MGVYPSAYTNMFWFLKVSKGFIPRVIRESFGAPLVPWYCSQKIIDGRVVLIGKSNI